MSAPANNVLINNLVEFGLTPKEAKIYIALLEFEIATVTEVAKVSGINRSSTYVILESLKQKGLVSVSEDKNVQQYVPTSPNMLLKTAERLAEKHEQIKNNIDAIIPDLKTLHKGTKQKPIVRVFEGKEGLMSLFEDSLISREKLMRVASSVENMLDIIPQEYFQDFLTRRFGQGIKMYGIHPNSKLTEYLLKTFPNSIDEQVIIPEGDFKFPSDFAIYDEKLAYMSPNNGGIGVIIESKEMADVMKSIFDLAFLGAKHTPNSKHILPR